MWPAAICLVGSGLQLSKQRERITAVDRSRRPLREELCILSAVKPITSQPSDVTVPCALHALCSVPCALLHSAP